MTACAKSPTGEHQFNWPAGWQWWQQDGWCYYCGDTTKENGRDVLAKEHATTEETNNHQGVNSMSNFTPTPKAPKGYVKVKDCADLWVGPDSTDRGWIVTPSWDAAADKHSLEVWTPEYNILTPAEARQLAQVLLASADAIEALAHGGQHA
jgi:hypothetical protein